VFDFERLFSIPNNRGHAVPTASQMFLAAAKYFETWWPGTESNRRRQPFQGCALPTELPGRSVESLSLADRVLVSRLLPEAELGPADAADVSVLIYSLVSAPS
jgi:hypothetical protein